MSVAGTLAGVDQSLLKLAKESAALLPALRQRFKAERSKPDSDAGQLEQLRKSIRELERAVALVRFQPSGEKTDAAPAVNRLQKSRKDEAKSGHKWVSRRRGPAGHWVYTYKDAHGVYEQPHIRDLHHLAGEHARLSKEINRAKARQLTSGRGGIIDDDSPEVRDLMHERNALWDGHQVESADFHDYLNQGKPLPAERRKNYAGNENDTPEPREADEVDMLALTRYADSLKKQSESLMDDESKPFTEAQLGALQGVWDAAHVAVGLGSRILDAGRAASYLSNRADSLDQEIKEASVGRQVSLRSQQKAFRAIAAGMRSGTLPDLASLAETEPSGKPAEPEPDWGQPAKKVAAPAFGAKQPKPKAPKAGKPDAEQSMMFSRPAPRLVLQKASSHEGPHHAELALSMAARGGSGRFTQPGTADHLAAHRKTYHAKKEAGEIAGTREDWQQHATDGWRNAKETHAIDLLADYRHLEAELRGLEDEGQIAEAKEKLESLRTRLGRLGRKV